jgi:hypothetical protein
VDALLALPGAAAAPGRAKALTTAAVVAWRQGDPAAMRAYSREALGAARAHGDRWREVYALVLLAGPGAARTPGGPGGPGAGPAEGEAPSEADPSAALAAAREVGEPWLLALAQTALGMGAARGGDAAGAALFLEGGLTGFRETGDPWGVAEAAADLGPLVLRRGEPERAARLFAEALTVYRDTGHWQGVARCLAGAAGAAVAQGDPRRAARLLGAAQALLDGVRGRLEGAHLEELGRSLAAARTQLGAGPFAAAWAAGRALPPDEAAREALGAGGAG